MSENPSRTPSSSNNDAIRNLRNDPDVYMEIRPTRNSNACASCRKKKKRCEPGIHGPNTTCKRCSDYGLECKYEHPIAQQSASSSPTISTASPSPPSHSSSPQYNRKNLSVRLDSGAPWSHRGGSTASHNVPAPFDTTFAPPSHSGNLPPSITRAGISPFTNTYGVLHQGNLYPNPGTNSSYPSQELAAPFTTTDRAANPYTGSQFGATQFDPLFGGNNSFGGLTRHHNNQVPMNFAQPTPPKTCECTLETTCYLHRPPRSVPSDTPDLGWTQNSYFQQ